VSARFRRCIEAGPRDPPARQDDGAGFTCPPDQARVGTIVMGRRSVAGRFTLREDVLDRAIVGLLGAVAALGAVSSAEAMPMAVPLHVLRANSYAELLEPIDKASEFLRALDAQRTARADEGRVDLARYRHHHHHHDRRKARHHHQQQHEEYLRY